MSDSTNRWFVEKPAIRTSIAPWLTVINCAKALEFYISAFAAEEVYRLATPDDELMVARLSIDGAEFWISEGSPDSVNVHQPTGEPVRMILTVADPDAVFAQALQAGATEIFPVGEEHGWRLGRLMDPFGNHWEVGYQLMES